MAKYVDRIAQLPEVFAELASHPDGLPLATLASMVGVPQDELREAMLAYFTAEPAWTLGLSRPNVLEFLGPDGSEQDPNEAEIVRVRQDGSADLGVEYLDADELALIYTASSSLLDVSPDDETLASAVAVITETMFGEPGEGPRPARWNALLPELQDAQAASRKVRIEYSRAWSVGVGTRVIDPYRLVQTRRGWEVDAGPPDPEGKLRTFLLSNVREAEVLDETFERPDGLTAMLEAQRTTTTVRMGMPHDARWAADMYAEKVTVVEEDDESFTADLELLPPVDGRVGLMMLAGGETTRVLSPAGLISAGPELARSLLEHHAKPPRT